MNVCFSGKFIVLDGPDGCGKSTQTKLLAEWLEKQNIRVCTCRDPGTTVIGEKIRQILLDAVHEQMTDSTEVLLYMAARAQLWHETIGPSLAAGKCVVMDRWLSSTCAYQGFAGGFGIDRVVKLAQNCLERVWPDITIILDIYPEDAAARMNRTLDRMERKGRQYHKKVRDGFIKLAKKYKNITVIDAKKDISEVHESIVKIITERLVGSR